MKISSRKINDMLPFIPTSLEYDISKASEILLSVEGKLPNGRWSGPSAVGIIGLGIGGQIGAEITDLIIALNSPEDIDSFSSNTAVLVGTNITIASPTIGRNIEVDVNLLKGSTVFSYSHSRGLFAGISLEGTLIVERKSANKKYYNKKITAKEILTRELETSELTNTRDISKLYFSIQLRNDRTIADVRNHLACAEHNILPDYQASRSLDYYQDFKNSNESVHDTKIDDKDSKVDVRPESEIPSFKQDQITPELPPRKKF
ncbi:SH3 domain-containing protein [Smittium culicis]|uniref:SH3 domain-containing protein n=1 Tax=Smittium culicis TaxID=133412 RepID=A0A1R1YC96_9FUNG|nr:SH3 domain-containing protein [Smittium culicis]